MGDKVRAEMFNCGHILALDDLEGGERVLTRLTDRVCDKCASGELKPAPLELARMLF